MAKTKTIHAVPEDRFPLTACGVDVVQKTGADWVMDNEEDFLNKITCVNCIKVLSKGKVKVRTRNENGEATTQTVLAEEDLLRIKQEDHITKLYKVRSKLEYLIADVRGLIGESEPTNKDEASELNTVVGWMEAAKAGMEFATIAAKGEKPHASTH